MVFSMVFFKEVSSELLAVLCYSSFYERAEFRGDFEARSGSTDWPGVLLDAVTL